MLVMLGCTFYYDRKAKKVEMPRIKLNISSGGVVYIVKGI